MQKASFQGEPGAYSEDAALCFFNNKIETVPFPTFFEILEATQLGRTDFSILPIENSIEGSVGESYDLLLSTTLIVSGEIYYRIKHCLIGFEDLEKINTVYSHPQALGQCRNFIQRYKLKPIPTYDTAGSVKILLQLKDSSAACIASKKAAEIYNVPVIRENIADNFNNYTRFLILGKEKLPVSGKDKTSIIFSIKHIPGALHRILEKFSSNQINLTKIESRPTKSTPWEYNFYVDFEGHENEPIIVKVLREVEKETTFLKILGSYPRAELF